MTAYLRVCHSFFSNIYRKTNVNNRNQLVEFNSKKIKKTTCKLFNHQQSLFLIIKKIGRFSLL